METLSSSRQTAVDHGIGIIPPLNPMVPDDLVLEALALAKRVNERLKDRTPPATPRLRETSSDEESYHPGELVC